MAGACRRPFLRPNWESCGNALYFCFARSKALNDDAAQPRVSKITDLTSSAISFNDLPGQSKLFLDHLRDPLQLRPFYPNAVAKVEELASYVPLVLDGFETNRDALCNALVEINTDIANGPAALSNIDRLRQSDSVAVVTGQQAGLLTGPLYTVHKAITTVATADRLRSLGVNAVPVFWAATEDHDFDEVSTANVINGDGRIARLEYSPVGKAAGRSVGEVTIGTEITELLDTLFRHLGSTEFTPGLRRSVEESWQPGAGFGVAFERQLAHIFAEYGLVMIDPLHAGLKKLAAPLYSRAAALAGQMVEAMRHRGTELERAGYHEQVLVEDHYFPLFWHDGIGRRLALQRTEDGVYAAKDGTHRFTIDELVRLTLTEPRRFSPGVMLRPVVQDYLLPSICYIGGGAEIAYFAQNSEAYRVLERPITPILPRQSFTIVASKHRRTMERFGLTLADLFDGVDQNLQKIGSRSMAHGVSKHFEEALKAVDQKFAVLRQDLSSLDKTLVGPLEKRRRKIIYHIESLRRKASLAEARHDSTVERQLREAMTALVPNGHLQERVLNVTGFLNKYGPYLIKWLYDETDVNGRDHKLIYI